VEIGLHQLGDDINVVVIGRAAWFLNINQLNDVVVVEEFYISS